MPPSVFMQNSQSVCNALATLCARISADWQATLQQAWLTIGGATGGYTIQYSHKTVLDQPRTTNGIVEISHVQLIVLSGSVWRGSHLVSRKGA